MKGDDVITILRDDLRWLTEIVPPGWEYDPHVSRARAALRSEGLTVDEKIRWSGEDGTEGRVIAKRYCTEWVRVEDS